MILDQYKPHLRKSPLTDPWEPLFSFQSEDAVCIAVEIRKCHCNTRNFAHGGVLSALADNAMGLSTVLWARRKIGRENSNAVTVSLALDFLESAHIGDWVEFVPMVLRVGGTLAVVDCRVVSGNRLIARGNGIFRIA
jgi:uncharacterized protein (TIGR00369 family)